MFHYEDKLKGEINMFKNLGTSFKTVGAAMLGAANYQLSRPEFYLTVGAIGGGVVVASKSAKQAIGPSLYTAIGIIGCTGLQIVSGALTPIVENVTKAEDV
jgi:uncharacterized membrane protein YdcZ (DUF606 family)